MGSAISGTFSHLRDATQAGRHGNARDRLNAMTQEQKKNNLRMGLTLASVALVFFIGFMVKMIFFGR